MTNTKPEYENRLNKDYEFNLTDLNSVKLSDIPEFTDDMRVELANLKQDYRADVAWPKNDRLMQLAFLRAANFHKEYATDDFISWYEAQNEESAIKSYLRFLEY